jgi:hypothetical protein
MSAIAPESFDLSSLPCLPLSGKGKLPSCAAVYFALSSQGRVLYIGRSIDIRERFRGHHRLPLLEALGGVRIAWLEQSDSLALRRIETILIKYFNPPLNKIPSYLKEEDTEKLINYLTLNERNHKSNIIPINKLLASQSSKKKELVNQIETESKLPLPCEPGWCSPSEFKEVILEQATRIKHLEEKIADLQLMFQEQMQANRQLTEALIEQAKAISELSRIQVEANSRLSEVTVEQALTISKLSSALEETRYDDKAED